MNIPRALAASAAGLLGLVAGAITATTPAQAASCYNRGGYSFTSKSDRLSSEFAALSEAGQQAGGVVAQRPAEMGHWCLARTRLT